MKAMMKIKDLVNSGDLYSIEDKISELKYTLAACFDVNNSINNAEIGKMQYQLSILQDVKNRIIEKNR